ncbi:MAG: nicotinate phosphoribosyltransferase [Bernardetiaceae bacterium]|nr:nicotinate phosphoribosyltransferase [Bernardetiaceae bacterium]
MSIYKPNLSMLTDLYQLSMAQGYWKTGTLNEEAVFHLFFRRSPFQGGYTVACGLAQVIDYLSDFSFKSDDIAYLRGIEGNDGNALFDADFLTYLEGARFSCDIDAVPEGTVVFPHEPLVRVRGPLYQCQLIETALLTLINFQTLIATKAARVCSAAAGEPVLEFGLRRAQGIDGGLSASRAAYIGGCAATSNVLAGKLYGIPVKGTHAHSWVMSFDSEIESFEAYAEAMPNNCVFLVDTYDTLEGVRQAVKVGEKLKAKGHKMVGIRLDSGDLAYLSIEARKILDAAGFQDATIVASNDLDEHLIESLKIQDAKISVWGVGTKLATAYDQPALGGVYKLSALRKKTGEWDYKLKLSEQAIKISNPGVQQVRRFYTEEECIADMIYDEDMPPVGKDFIIIDPMDMTRRKRIASDIQYRELLQPIFRKGECVYQSPTIQESRAHVQNELKSLHRSIKRFKNPHVYPVGLEKQLHQLKTDLILKLRGF